MSWKSKVALDTVKAFLPFQSELRRLKRRFFPYETDSAIDEDTFEQGLSMIRMLQGVGTDLRDKTVLELGSGWQPIIPTLCYLAGCRKIILTDLTRLMDESLVRNATRLVASKHAQVTALTGLGNAQIRRLLQFSDAGTLQDLHERLNMEYVVPFDPGDVPSGSIDIIISRTVLEHIKPHTLVGLLREFRRILCPEGLMCHVIDMSDHFEHRDKSIPRVNFLKFGELAWALTGLNTQNYQNRLRHFEYLGMFQDTGFELVDEIAEPDPDAVTALKTMCICKRYSDMPHDELAILTSFVLVRNTDSRY